MNYYESEGHRKTQAEDIQDAALRFASIKAKRMGKAWRVVTLQPSSWTTDNSSVQYRAFLGVCNRKDWTVSGVEEWFNVNRC
jgi:hypothetical protein